MTDDGQSVFVSEECGGYIYRFDRRWGRRIDVSKLPDSFSASTLIVALDGPVLLVRDRQGTICRIMCLGSFPVLRGLPATRRNAAS